jgi:hypothetical protein
MLRTTLTPEGVADVLNYVTTERRANMAYRAAYRKAKRKLDAAGSWENYDTAIMTACQAYEKALLQTIETLRHSFDPLISWVVSNCEDNLETTMKLLLEVVRIPETDIDTYAVEHGFRQCSDYCRIRCDALDAGLVIRS